MWLKLEKTKEFIPVNEQMTEKVFLDGAKGWCIKQKDGSKYHITEKERAALDAEIDRDAYWKRKEIENTTKDLDGNELKKVRKLIEAQEKKMKDKEED